MTMFFPMIPDYVTNAVSKAESCKPHPVGNNLVRDSSVACLTLLFYLPVIFYTLCCLSLTHWFLKKALMNLKKNNNFFCLLNKIPEEELRSFSDLPFCFTEAAGILRYKRECDTCRLHPPNIHPGVSASMFIIYSHAATSVIHWLYQSHCVQAQPLTEYPVKCEFCRETAKPLLDEQDPKVRLKGSEGLENATNVKYTWCKTVLRVTFYCVTLRKLWSSAVPSGSSCMRYWRNIDVTLGQIT